MQRYDAVAPSRRNATAKVVKGWLTGFPLPVSSNRSTGGYFDREDVEKVAVLRARLGLDNSQLIQLAVNELYKKHNAQRAFGDVNR